MIFSSFITGRTTLGSFFCLERERFLELSQITQIGRCNYFVHKPQAPLHQIHTRALVQRPSDSSPSRAFLRDEPECTEFSNWVTVVVATSLVLKGQVRCHAERTCARIKHRNGASGDTAGYGWELHSPGERQWRKEQIKPILLLWAGHESLVPSHCHSADIAGHSWWKATGRYPIGSNRDSPAECGRRP